MMNFLKNYGQNITLILVTDFGKIIQKKHSTKFLPLLSTLMIMNSQKYALVLQKEIVGQKMFTEYITEFGNAIIKNNFFVK
jgi:hypothetical protein